MISQCPYCGQGVRPGARFCAKCGRPIPGAFGAPNQPLQIPQARNVVRIMSWGEILSNSVRFFFRYFFRLLLASLVGYAVWALMTLVLFVLLLAPIVIVSRTNTQADDAVIAVFAALVLSLPLAVINAPITLAVSSLVLAGRFSFANLVASVFGRRLLHLLITVALQSFLVFLGSLLFLLPGIYLAIAFSMTPAAVMLEDRAGRGALRRSHQLVRGFWWKTFGLLFVSYMLPIGVFLLLAFAVGAVAGGSVPTYLLIGLLLLATLGVPCFAAVVQVLLYYDLRSRRGAFNAESLLTMPTLRPIYERI